MSKASERYIDKFRAYLDTRAQFESLRADLQQAQNPAPSLWSRYQEQFMLDSWCYGKEARELLLSYVFGDENAVPLSSIPRLRRLGQLIDTPLAPLSEAYRQVVVSELEVFRAHKEMQEEATRGDSLENLMPENVQDRLNEQVNRPGGRELYGRLLLSPIWQEMDWQRRIN